MQIIESATQNGFVLRVQALWALSVRLLQHALLQRRAVTVTM